MALREILKREHEEDRSHFQDRITLKKISRYSYHLYNLHGASSANSQYLHSNLATVSFFIATTDTAVFPLYPHAWQTTGD